MDKNIDYEELEKGVSDICVISEKKNTFSSVINWILNVPKSDIIEMFGLKGKKSDRFSIGSSYYCNFKIFNNKVTILIFDYKVTFTKGIPEGAWVEGKISINKGKSVSFSGYRKDAIEGITVDLPEDTLNQVLEQAATGSSSSLESLRNHPLRFFMKVINQHLKTLHLPSIPVQGCARNMRNIVLNCYIIITLPEIKCTLDRQSQIQHIKSNSSDKQKQFVTSLYERHLYSDVTISVGGCEIKAHKVILSKICAFQEMFDKDKTKHHFELTDISAKILKKVINYLYTEEIPELNFRLASELYVVANDLEMLDLKNICSSYLGANLTQENVFIVITLSTECRDIELKLECIKFIRTSDSQKLAAESVVI